MSERKAFLVMYLTSLGKERDNYHVKSYFEYIDKYRRGLLETEDFVNGVFNICSAYFQSNHLSALPPGGMTYAAKYAQTVLVSMDFKCFGKLQIFRAVFWI